MSEPTTIPLSPERLAEIRERAAAATPGPWGTYDDGTGRYDIAAELQDTGHGFTCRRQVAQTVDEPIDNDPAHRDWDADEDDDQIFADAEFIAHAREDLPALLAEVERLRSDRDRFADRVDTLTSVAKGNLRHVQELTKQLMDAEKPPRIDRLCSVCGGGPDVHTTAWCDRRETTTEPELTVYRAQHDSIPMGLYTTRQAAYEHCTTYAFREDPTLSLSWKVDPDDGVAELFNTFCFRSPGAEKSTGYVVTPLAVASAYDEEADE